MTKTEFAKIIDEFENNRIKVLKEKNALYAPEDDALHNFHVGANIDRSTTCQTIWHYAKKHFVALLDKIENNSWENIDDAFEKLGDIMNYLDFMWAAANEEKAKTERKKNETGDSKTIDYSSMGFCTVCYKFCPIEYRGCDCCDNFQLDSNKEPCASCKKTKIIGTKEYENAPLNWKPERKEK